MLTINITLSNAHHEVKHVLVFESDEAFTVEALDKRLWGVAARVCEVESIHMDTSMTLKAMYDMLETKGYQLELATV
jgi:hypothetical protein